MIPTRRDLLAATSAFALTALAGRAGAAEPGAWEELARRAERLAADGRAAIRHARRRGMDPAALSGLGLTPAGDRRAYLTFGDHWRGDGRVYAVTAVTFGVHERL